MHPQLPVLPFLLHSIDAPSTGCGNPFFALRNLCCGAPVAARGILWVLRQRGSFTVADPSGGREERGGGDNDAGEASKRGGCAPPNSVRSASTSSATTTWPAAPAGGESRSLARREGGTAYQAGGRHRGSGWAQWWEAGKQSPSPLGIVRLQGREGPGNVRLLSWLRRSIRGWAGGKASRHRDSHQRGTS